MRDSISTYLLVQRVLGRLPLAICAMALFALGGCTGEATTDEAVVSSSESLCQGVQLSVNEPGTLSGIVTLTASGTTCATGETAEYLFRFRQDDSKGWSIARDWDSSPTFDWDVSSIPAGYYQLHVEARAQGSTSFESSKLLRVYIGEVCGAVTLTSDLPSPQLPGPSVTFSANATCTSGSAEYRFQAVTAAGDVVVLQDWASAPSVVWDTSALPRGSYQIRVAARRAGNANAETRASLDFALGESCTLPTVKLSAQVAARGDDVRIYASSQCTGNATPQYRYTYRRTDVSSYQLLQDWTDQAQQDLVTDALDLANYTIRVEVRPNDGATQAEGQRLASLLIGDCSIASVSASPRTQIAPGGVVTLKAVASCGDQTPEYQFVYFASGVDDGVVIQDFSELGTATLDTSGLWGQYQVYVFVRPAGSSGEGTSRLVRNLNIAGDCSGDTIDVALHEELISALRARITVVATPITCALGQAEYRFTYRGPGAVGTHVLRDWSPATTASLEVSNLVATGEYEFDVDARPVGIPAGHESEYAHGSASIDTSSSCRVQSPKIEPVSPGVFRVTAALSCSVGQATLPDVTISYRRVGDADWVPVVVTQTPNSYSFSFEWKAGALTRGDYEIKIDVHLPDSNTVQTRILHITL